MILQQYSYTVEVARRLCQTPRAGAQFGWQDLSTEQLLHCSVAGACSRLPPSRRKLQEQLLEVLMAHQPIGMLPQDTQRRMWQLLFG
jgi:hypothetical protein